MAKRTDTDTEIQDDATDREQGGVNHQARQAAINTKAQDDDINHGHRRRPGETEDEKRAEGTDASSQAGPHDFSPEANRGGSQGGLYDTYAHGHVEHPNVAGPTAELVLGQAPVVPAFPMRGSDAAMQDVDMNKPNAINQSPRIVGVDIDPRNDPAHPQHADANKDHPDYGKPANLHRGQRPDTPTYDDVNKANAAA